MGKGHCPILLVGSEEFEEKTSNNDLSLNIYLY